MNPRKAPALDVFGRENSPVVHKRIHESPFLDHFPEFRAFLSEVSIVVVRDYDAVQFDGQSEDIAIVVADRPLASDQSGRCEHDDPLLLQIR